MLAFSYMFCGHKYVFHLLLSTLFSLGGAVAFANAVGNDTQNFNPITSGVDFVTVQSTQPLEMGFLNIGTFINSAVNVLPDTYDINNKLINSNDTLTFTDLNMGYGLLPWMDIGLNVSYIVKQDTDRTETGAQFSKTGLNEIRANAKIQLLERRPIGIATILSMNLNQVKNNPFIGRNAGPTSNFELAFDTEAWNSVFAFNMGYRFRNPGTQLSESYFSPLGSEYLASAAVSHYFTRWDFKLIGEIIGSMPASKSNGVEQSFASEYLIGGKYDYNRFFALHAGAGQRITQGLFAPDARLYAGLNINLEVFDVKANRPALLENTSKKVEMDVYSGFQPQEIKELSQQPFEQIVANHEFALRKQIPKDIQDKDKPPFEVFRLDGFEFAFGSSVIEPKYETLLQDLIKYLNSEPKVMKVRVEGHTDSLGSEERNKSRSASRAAAVKDYLKRHGVHSDIQLDSIGYGSDKPIADNSNAQGRSLNRRVEVRILREILPPEKKTIIEEN